MNKKGQAALEFLATYGWAVVVVIICIWFLAYYGLINPNKFIQDQSCNQTRYDIRNVEACKTIFNDSISAYKGNESFAYYELQGRSCQELYNNVLGDWANHNANMFNMDKDIWLMRGCLK